MSQPADNVVRLNAALAKIEGSSPEAVRDLRKAALDLAVKYASRKGRSNVAYCVECASAFALFLADGSIDSAPSVGV